jgi:CheY-like chemotaxis protein/HPt (histidine-containing phosphotransfer) domain-containing protein
MIKVDSDKHVKVLVVEDNVISRTVITAMFEDLDCNVTAVETAEEAFISSSENSFDLILLDQILPGKSGNEAAPILKKMQPKATIIGIFGTVTPSSKKEAILAGMFDVISKPLNKFICQSIIESFNARKSKTFESQFTSGKKATSPLSNSLATLQGFDVSTIEEISSLGGGGESFLSEMLLTFVQEFEKNFPLGGSLTDKLRIISWAHKLKGLCVNIGCLDLGELFESLELNPELRPSVLLVIEEIFSERKKSIDAYIDRE